MAREHLDTSSEEVPDHIPKLKKKKKSKSRIKKKRPIYCANSSKSLNLTRTRYHHVSTTALKKNNEELAKSLNKCKEAIGLMKSEKLSLERELMDLREENVFLRNNADQSQIEVEVQKRLVDYLGPVRGHINSAMDHMVGLSDNLTQSMQLVSAPMRVSSQSQQQQSSGPHRSSSIGANFRMRSVANFNARESGSGASGNSPPKQLSKVSPMVAGHAISRPRIQLTRMDIAAMRTAREQLSNEIPDNVVETNLPVQDEVEYLEEPQDEYEDVVAISPTHPGRSRFNLTNIGEENSFLEDTRLDESILEASIPEESPNTEQVMESLEVVPEVNSQDEEERISSPEQSFRRQSRSALGFLSRGRQSLNLQEHASDSRVAANTTCDLQLRRSNGRFNVRHSPVQTKVSPKKLSPKVQAQLRVSRGPLREVPVPSSSPQVDILKTQRHPAVVLSDLVTMNHPDLPPQYNQLAQHSTPLLPTPSPLKKSNAMPTILVDEFPEDPSESFLEQMCEDPLEGPSWLFASVSKKKRRSSAVRKLSAVWSDSEGASTMTSGRATGSLDTSDLDISSPGASSREVSGYILDKDLLETAVVLSPDLVLDKSEVEVTVEAVKSVNSSVVGNRTSDLPEDMELTTAASLLNNSNQENNPLAINAGEFYDESNLSISVTQNPRTPLSSLTYTDPSGEVVKFNPRTDTGVTVAGLREAHILLSNVGMAGRSTTPYKLSECYIDLSPGRSMSLDQLFSLGLRAGISSPDSNSPRAKKRKYVSEAPRSIVSPPSNKRRATDVNSLRRQRGVRASLDLIPSTQGITEVGLVSNASRNLVQHSPVKKIVNVEDDRSERFAAEGLPTNSTGHGEVIEGEISEKGESATEIAQQKICSDITSKESVVVRKLEKGKKSLHPSFVMLEKTPVKAVQSKVSCESNTREEIIAPNEVVQLNLEQDETPASDPVRKSIVCTDPLDKSLSAPPLNNALHLNVETTQVTADATCGVRGSCGKVDQASIDDGMSCKRTSKGDQCSIDDGISSKKASVNSSKGGRQSKKLKNVDDVRAPCEDFDQVGLDNGASSKPISSKGGRYSRKPVEESNQVMVSDEEPEIVPVALPTVDSVVEVDVPSNNEKPTNSELSAKVIPPDASSPPIKTNSRVSKSHGSSKVCTEVVETSGRPRRGAAVKVSYTEPPLGKKLRQDAGACVYTDGNIGKRKSSTSNTKSRKSVKKK